MLKHIALWLFCCGLLPAAQLVAAQTPLDCEQSPKHRQFDFWLGQWAVVDANNKPLGRNRITKVQGGCALREQWRSASGGTGESLNYFNPITQTWHQLWVDKGYSVISISGNLGDEAMLLEGTITYLANGQQHAFRGLWTPLEDGRVRQFFEQADEQGNWQTWFEGFYQREPVNTGNSS